MNIKKDRAKIKNIINDFAKWTKKYLIETVLVTYGEDEEFDKDELFEKLINQCRKKMMDMSAQSDF